MSTVDTQVLPTGRWQVDKVHSSIGFAVDYMAGTFHGTFGDFEADDNVDVAVLTGAGGTFCTTCTTGPVPSSRSATPIVPGPPNSWGIPLPLHPLVRTH